MEKLLALEMVRVTEAAAHRLRAVHGPGRPRRGRPGRDRGDAPDDGRDRASPARSSSARASATRRRCSTSARRSAGGRGTASRRPRDRHRRRPARGHEPRRATARPTRSPCSPRPRRAACSTPPTRTSRSCASGRSRPARSTSATSPTENLAPDRRRPSAASVDDITVVILERPRHEELIARGPRGRRAHQADQRRRPVGGDQLRRPGTGVHAVMGIGGAPEGVITAAALRCLGGEIQARFRFRNDEERAARRAMGHGDEEPGLPHRGPRVGREPRLRRDRRHRRRPARGRPLLRRRRAHPLARDGLPDQAGPLRRHGPHVRPRPAAGRPALAGVDRGRRRAHDRRDGRRRVPDGARQPASSTTTSSRWPASDPGRDAAPDLPDPDRDRRRSGARSRTSASCSRRQGRDRRPVACSSAPTRTSPTSSCARTRST